MKIKRTNNETADYLHGMFVQPVTNVSGIPADTLPERNGYIIEGGTNTVIRKNELCFHVRSPFDGFELHFGKNCGKMRRYGALCRKNGPSRVSSG